jgi:hypothetical protein
VLAFQEEFGPHRFLYLAALRRRPFDHVSPTRRSQEQPHAGELFGPAKADRQMIGPFLRAAPIRGWRRDVFRDAFSSFRTAESLVESRRGVADGSLAAIGKNAYGEKCFTIASAWERTISLGESYQADRSLR